MGLLSVIGDGVGLGLDVGVAGSGVEPDGTKVAVGVETGISVDAGGGAAVGLGVAAGMGVAAGAHESNTSSTAPTYSELFVFMASLPPRNL